MTAKMRHYTHLFLGALFLLALAMGCGPGVLLIDQSAFWWGFPALYVWALLWCSVEMIIVTAAYFLVWIYDEQAPPAVKRDAE